MTTEVKRTRPLNRLQTMYALRNVYDQLYKDAQEANETGKPVAWCMMEPYTSLFFNAIGMSSVYPEQYATVCAAAGAAPAYLDRAEAEGFPTHLCSYLRNTFGYTARMKDLGWQIPPEAPRGGIPKPALLICSGMGCEARYKGFQALGRYMEAPVWTTEVMYHGQVAMHELLDNDRYERSVDFIVQELREFVTLLEHLLGKKTDWDKFEEDINGTMALNKEWHELYELRKARPCPMNGRDHHSSIGFRFRATDPKVIIDLYRKMYDEVKYRVDNKIAGINRPEKYRVLWEGLGPYHYMDIYDRLAERGWNFVREPQRAPTPIDLSWVKDPIEKWVRYKQRSLAWEIDNEFEPEEAAKIREEIKQRGFSDQLAVKDARDYQIDGAFIQTVLTCRPNAGTTGFQQQQLMRAWKVPSLIIVADMIDPRLTDLEDIMRKAEAFEETMDYYKEERKKAELPW